MILSNPKCNNEIMIKKALLIPDTHRPFHDKRAYNLMLQVGQDLDPDEVVLLGDYADFYSVSSHAKDPRIFSMLEDEIVDVLAGLTELDTLFKRSKKVFIVGNHSKRLENYLCNTAPALFGITSIEHLFEFKKRPNWHVIPYGPNQKYSILNSKLFARHEPLGNSAELTARKAMCSITFGHIHKIQSAFSVGMDGTQHVAFCCGWLGDKNKNKVFDYVKNHHSWQLGFAVVYVDTATGYFYHNIINILPNYTCIFNGKLYRG